MAIDQRQIADIKSLKPEFVTDPIQAATPPSIGITWNNNDKKYHISLKLPQFVIDGTSTSPPVTEDPPTTEDPPVVTVTTVDSSKLTLKSYGPFYEDGTTTYSINANLINNFDNIIMRLDGTTSSDEAGTYTIKIYLRNTTLYKWSDSTLSPSDPVTLEWTINPKRELKDCTPAEIVAVVRSGKAASTWSVGDKIPITFESRFKLHSGDSSYIESGTYDAVVLGFDHNVTNETSTVSHNMAFAIMYRHDSTQATCLFSKTLTADIYDQKHREVCDNIYNALPASWQNIITKTKKTFFERRSALESGSVKSAEQNVFFLAPYEIGTMYGVAVSEYSSNKQQTYEYFGLDNVGFPYSIKASNSDNNDLIIMSRSSITESSDSRAAALLLSRGSNTKYSYCSTESDSSKKWRAYSPYVVITDRTGMSIDNPDAYAFTDVTFGIIPCFTIG